MKPPVVLILCNALDDNTRLLRQIHTDSPAASRKVLMLGEALLLAGVKPYVLSLGRGKANGSFVYFKGTIRRIKRVPVLYAPFCHIPLASSVISLSAPIWSILRFARCQTKAVIFYNRLPAYLPSLLVASLAGFKTVLDLEDGEIEQHNQRNIKQIVNRTLRYVYDMLCRDGVLLACRALAVQTKIWPLQCYYGTAKKEGIPRKITSPMVKVLMSGTLTPDTGSQILIDAIQEIRRESPTWAERLQFAVCGMGSSLEDFYKLVNQQAIPEVVVHGRTTDNEYRDLLNQCEVGLALKPINGALADTTFPSKVVEFASAGLLVITTDISDVREVLGDGALYLTSNDPQELVNLLQSVVENRTRTASCAKVGQQMVLQRCSPYQAGRTVANFIFRAQS